MIRFTSLLLCVLIAVPAWGDEPKKKPHMIFDRKAIIAGLTMLAAETADNETTLASIRRNPRVSELNPMYGSHPSRLRMYGVGTGLTGLMYMLSLGLRSQAARQGHPDSNIWLMPVVIHNTFRSLAAWHNSTLSGSRAPSVRVCPAAGSGCR